MEQQLITRQTIIEDILARKPEKAMELSQILMDFGIHCVGCMASGFETLEQGVLGHGFSEEELETLVNELNTILTEGEHPVDVQKTDEPFSLILTPRAVEKVKHIIHTEANKDEGVLRVSVLAGGCSGFVYDLELITEKKVGDHTFIHDGLTVAVGKDSLELLNGTTIDYVDTLNESGFKFLNPNSTKACGCGKSFS